MNEFYIGLGNVSDAWPFKCCMVSVAELHRRKRSDFRVNEWIMDSGGFSQLSKHGQFLLSPDDYLEDINRFCDSGKLRAAVAQDWMCEPAVIARTGKSVEEHQELTMISFLDLRQWTDIPIMAVLQGQEPEDYAAHVRSYGKWLELGAWVGVGSVCRLNGDPDAIEDRLLAIKRQRPDLRLHGFGLKMTALSRPTVRALLHSADSMAWSYAGRKNDGDAHDPRLALSYAARVQTLLQKPSLFIQEQLFHWWADNNVK